MSNGTNVADIHYGPGCAVRSCDRRSEPGRCYCGDCAKSVGANPASKVRNDGSAAAYVRWAYGERTR